MSVGERLQNFESGTAGAASTSNPPTSNGQTAAGAIGVSGTGAVNVVAAGTMSGSKYLECTQTTTTASDAYFRWLGYSTTSGAFAFSWQTDTLPSSGTQIFFRAFSNTNNARWLNGTINSTNHMVISVFNGTTDVIVWTSTQTISAATNYQIAGTFSAFGTSSTVTLAINVYTDDFTTLWETGYSGTPSLAATATTVIDFRFGRNSVTLTGPKFRYDNIRVTDLTSTMYGPANAFTGGSTLANTATLATAGTVGAATTSTLAATATVTAAGVVGKVSGATATTTATLSTAGTVAASTGATLAATAAITAAGVVGCSTGATLTVTAATVAAGGSATSTTATLAATATLTTAGTVGTTTTTTVPAAVTFTTTATLGASTAASLDATALVAAAGVVTAVSEPEAFVAVAVLAPTPTIVTAVGAGPAITVVLAPSNVAASLEAQP